MNRSIRLLSTRCSRDRNRRLQPGRRQHRRCPDLLADRGRLPDPVRIGGATRYASPVGKPDPDFRRDAFAD